MNIPLSLPSLSAQCASCRVCAGAAYQSPPVLICGNVESPILVIGQNPGEIKNDDFRLSIAQAFKKYSEMEHIDGRAFIAWYDSDFTTSNGYSQLVKVFGDNWTDRLAWTNSVRCRTPGNNAPSVEMVRSCSTWTSQLTQDRTALVCVGSVAKEQVFPPQMKDIGWGKPVRANNGVIYLAIPHYGAWGRMSLKKNDIQAFAKAFNKVEEAVNAQVQKED